MIDARPKIPKPLKIVLPASAENTIFDMTGAHSDMTVQQLPTTFKPNFQTNMKATYTAPITTFHPKANMQNIMTMHPKTTAQTISTFNPKATIQTVSANDVPTNKISTYHPKAATFKVTQEISAATKTNDKYSSRFSAETTSFVPSTTPTIRPNVKHLLATIGLEPDNTPAETEQMVSSTKQITASTQLPSTTTSMTAESTSKPKPELTPELKELLESFGLLTNEEPPAHVTAQSYQDEFLPIFPSALKDDALSVSEFRPLPKSVTASDIEEKIDSSPEIKPDDFSSFKPLPIPESKSAAADDELENLLKTYGLLVGENDREDKTTDDTEYAEPIDSEESESETHEVTEKMNEVSQEVNIGFLPPNLNRVLNNMGMNNVGAQTTSMTPMITKRIDTTTPIQYSTGVVPSSTMENDYQKLHLLLDTIKQLDSLNANLTEEELEKLNLKNFNLSQDILTESQGPDPTDIIEDTSDAKNEVKRQTNSSEPTRIQLDVTGTTPAPSNSTDSKSDTNSEKSSDSKSDSGSDTNSDSNPDDLNIEDDGEKEDTKADDSASSATSEREGKNEDLENSESSSTTSTTEEPKNDLAGSFGGNDGLDPVSEEPLPPPRKNGFYFFSDWNSFLEVGEEPDKVVVRFDPKVGDPSPFIEVKIP